MNERIRLLAEQAGISIRDHYDESGSTTAELEKFAGLIVLRCVDQCHGVGSVIESMYTGEEARRYTSVAESCQRMINPYFSIK